MYRAVRALGLAASVVLAAACGGDDESGESTDAAETSAIAGDGPAFALMRGADTLLVEQFTLTGNRVSGMMRDPSGSSIAYETVHATDGGDRSMSLTMRSTGPRAAPPLVSTFTMRGDSVWLETSQGDSTVRQGDQVPGGALPYMSPSMGMMSLVVQSARSIVGDSGQVTLLAASVSQAPVVVSPLIFWQGDTAWVIGDQMNQFKLVFSNGQLVSVENAPQQMRAVRVTAGTAAPAETASTPQP